MYEIIYEYYRRFFNTRSVIPVPNSWDRLKDKNGKTFYYCKNLNYSQWDHPCLHFLDICKIR